MSLARRLFSEKRRYIYPLVAGLVLNAVLLLAVVLPLSRKADGGESAAHQASTALKAAQADYEAARATVSGKDSADAELKKFYGAVLPPDHSQARRIAFRLAELARKSNLALQRRIANPPAQLRDSALEKLTVQQVLIGQYRDIRQFIYHLETSPDFLILENVRLSQGQEGTGQLVLDVTVSTYYRAGGHGN